MFLKGGLKSTIKDSIKDFYFIGLWEKYFRVGHLSMSHLSLKLSQSHVAQEIQMITFFDWCLLGLFHSVNWFSPFKSEVQVTWPWGDACLICGFRALVQCVLWGLFLQSSPWSSGNCCLLADHHQPPDYGQAAHEIHVESFGPCFPFVLHFVQQILGWTDAPLISESCSYVKLSLVTSQPRFTFEV